MFDQIYVTHLNTTEDGFFDYSPIQGEYESVLEPFQFEKIDELKIARWVHRHWYIAPIAGFTYIGIIFAIQNWMKNRKAFDLKRELFWWNAGLGLFSAVGFLRMLPEIFHIVSQPNGFYRSVCALETWNHQGPTAFWIVLFVLSKYVELGDSVFIVLRKKPLVLLQWYHHFITLQSTWILFPYAEVINTHFTLINYFVHSLMYPYFALRALDIKIPKKIANIITALQLYQMVNNLGIISYTAYLYYSGVPCYRHPFTIKFNFFVAIVFNFLFGDLFYKSVILQGKKKV